MKKDQVQGAERDRFVDVSRAGKFLFRKVVRNKLGKAFRKEVFSIEIIAGARAAP